VAGVVPNPSPSAAPARPKGKKKEHKRVGLNMIDSTRTRFVCDRVERAPHAPKQAVKLIRCHGAIIPDLEIHQREFSCVDRGGTG
jgi:hypothetical protein